MDSLYSLIGVALVNENRNLDFACADHLDVYLCVIKSLKHLCSNTCVAFHTCAYDRNLGYALVNEDFCAVKALNVILKCLGSLSTSCLWNCKADVLLAVVTD